MLQWAWTGGRERSLTAVLIRPSLRRGERRSGRLCYTSSLDRTSPTRRPQWTGCRRHAASRPREAAEKPNGVLVFRASLVQSGISTKWARRTGGNVACVTWKLAAVRLFHHTSRLRVQWKQKNKNRLNKIFLFTHPHVPALSQDVASFMCGTTAEGKRPL